MHTKYFYAIHLDVFVSLEIVKCLFDELAIVTNTKGDKLGS